MKKLDDIINDTSATLKEKRDELEEFIDEQKAQMDTETRRKCRLFWFPVTIAALFLGILIGFFVN